MFSELSKIFRVMPRHAEHADARFETRRHERVEERNKGEKDKDSVPFDMDDDMSVSVSALIVFLKDFLVKEQPVPENQKDKDTDDAREGGSTEQLTSPESETTDDAYDNSKELGDLDVIRQTSPELQALDEKTKAQEERAKNERKRAISAYQSTGQKGAFGNVPPTLSQEKPASTGADILSSEDVRKIHTLLADLEKILERGIATLHLEPSDSFLNSLVAATETAKKII